MAIVLIVEDEDQVRVLAESVLQEHGHATLSASTLEQAVALLEGDSKIDLLFTDLGLHGDLQAGLTAAQEAVKRLPQPSGALYNRTAGNGRHASLVRRATWVDC